VVSATPSYVKREWYLPIDVYVCVSRLCVLEWVGNDRQ
jgi:hypothetical protein